MPSSPTQAGKLNVIFVVSWLICSFFYFIQYALRSAPSIMMTDIGQALSLDNTQVASIIGVYFYSYAIFSLVSGILLDRIGPRLVAPLGIILVAVGCLLFGSGYVFGAYVGRLLQGAGSGLAFTSAVFLATRGFPKEWLASAVGVTQCFGMMGGFMGQAVVSPVINQQWLTWQTFWFVSAAGLALVFMAALAVTPRTREGKVDWSNLTAPYVVVLKNPQSYLCALIAAFMFAPTNIGDFVWGTQFLEQGLNVPHDQVALRVAMIPLGWVIGCPILGYLSDFIGRRKPIIFAALVVMMVSGYAITAMQLSNTQHYVLGLIFGMASGAAMIPYTVIKEVNPDYVKGTATGVINFIVFVFSALMTNIMGLLIHRLAGGAGLSLPIFQQAWVVFLGILILALVLTCFVKETGSGHTPVVPLEQD